MSGHSRTFTDLQVEIIMQKPELFEEYWQVFTALKEPLSRRAAWVVTHAVTRNTELITRQHLKELLEIAPAMKTDGGKRNLTKILSLVSLPDPLLGPIVSLCFNWLDDPTESIAVRAYCMKVLHRITHTIPELKGELAATIENHYPHFSPGLRSKGAKVLSALNKRQ